MWYFIAFILSLSAGNGVLSTLFLAFLGRFYIVYWLIEWSGLIHWIQSHWMMGG